MTRWKLFKLNIFQLLVSIDQVLRCFVGLIAGLINGHSRAYADETLSAWAYRGEQRKFLHAKLLRCLIDVIMFMPEGFKWGHCKMAYETEKNRGHSPD